MKAFALRNRDLLQSLGVLFAIFIIAAVFSPRDLRSGQPLFLQARQPDEHAAGHRARGHRRARHDAGDSHCGIDLSVGSTLGLSAVVAALSLAHWHLGVAASIALAVGTGGLVGLLKDRLSRGCASSLSSSRWRR